MIHSSTPRPPGLALTALVALAALAVPATVRAADPVASVADLALPAVTYSHSTQTTVGTMSLTIDSSTNAAGWNVTIVMSPFVYSGTSNGADIPAANSSLTSAAAPVVTAGQAVDPTSGPRVPATSSVGSLDVARKTIEALAGYGEGVYTQALGVSLAIPGTSAAGTYTGTLTTTAAVGP